MLPELPKPTFSISIPRAALEAVFDECDRFDVDETGGRVLGTYRQDGGHCSIEVKSILGPGPNARRSPTSFFQDGAFQERQFRAIEAMCPDIEHLGNWHTHHVNGYPVLSGGDKATYSRTVNHDQHNTDFFYALLVVKKTGGEALRYAVKHYFFRRGDPTIYEIQPSEVQITDTPLLQAPSAQGMANQERVKDLEFFATFYPDLKSVQAAPGALAWKGLLPLADGSCIQIATIEDADGQDRLYAIAGRSKNPVLAATLAQYETRTFPAARHAVWHLEHDLNQVLCRHKRKRVCKPKRQHKPRKTARKGGGSRSLPAQATQQS